MSTDPRLRPTLLLATGLLFACTGCTGGGGGSSSSLTGFEVTRFSAPQGAVWKINREIEFQFSFPVDFSTVSSNTIHIASDDGVPATGTFSFKRYDVDGDGIDETTDETTIVFQPNCPTQADFSDAGLQPGGIRYFITLAGRSSGTQNTVMSKDGRFLEETQERFITTPNSLDPSAIFLDTTTGPPIPVVRKLGASEVESGVTFVEIGNDPDPDTRIYFEFDSTAQTYVVVPGPAAPSAVPLNLYADDATRAAVFIEFNQAVDTSSTNISDRRLQLEFEDALGTWLPIETRVELIANCTSVGATVRLEPVGLLPAGSRFRAVVRPGFKDLVGDTILQTIDQFAVAPTASPSFGSLNNPNDDADEFLESFDFGGADPLSFQDTNAVFDTPEAKWDDGVLTAAFDFTGKGGPGGNFDWVVKPGQIFVFDTVSSSIVGGPNGIPTTIQESRGGIVDVRNLWVQAGGTLRVQGSNTMLLNATGEVRIDGIFDASGFNAKDVATLNTGHQPETGGAGAAGGGRGGNGSEVTTNSTPRGSPGWGPFGEEGTGGQGGESGYAPLSKGKDARRPGGGGGGRFAKDFVALPNPVGGLEVQPGFPGHAETKGAESNQSPARGGNPGRGPFQDLDPSNDFFGVKPVVEPDGMGGFQVTGLIRGELSSIWAGYGGGGGGDALPSNTFPTPKWTAASDEKGGGGGGAGGGIRIRALGPIVFGTSGRISADGGHGGTGENTNFLDHVGGTGGSGSGGHIVLESAVRIDFTDLENVGPDDDQNITHVSVRGAPMYIGATNPRDNIPIGISHGGSGSPGVIQLHVPSLNPPSNDPNLSDIIVTTHQATNPNVNGILYTFNRPPGVQLVPTFGARSKARSKWISLGGADRVPGGGFQLVEFLFDGVDTTPGDDFGKVIRAGNAPLELPPLLGPEAYPSATVALLADDVTLEITGASLDPLIQSAAPISTDIYLRTPTLLENFMVRINEIGNVAHQQTFDVSTASYDDATRTLRITVDRLVGTITEFTGGDPGYEYTLVPRYFRIVTNGTRDLLPSSSFVRITFDGAGDDGFGEPDEQSLLVREGSVADFNALLPGELKFFRFSVEFNLDQMAVGVTPTTKPVGLEFVRVPFRF